MTTAKDLVEAIAGQLHLPLAFDTTDGVRYVLDPKYAPYVHGDVLVIPIVSAADDA